MPDVRLVDLEVIKRFSLAVRRDLVPADELLAALDASRELVLAALTESAPPESGHTGPAAKRAVGRTTPRAVAKKAVAKKAVAKKAVAKKAVAKKAVPRAGTGRRGGR